MSAYGPLAQWYDGFTRDVPYLQFADFFEQALSREGKDHLALLDLCCGTGTLTWMLAERGHELIGVDVSPEMLALASGKTAEAAYRPLFLCQEAAELDLFGTVDGAYCSLDGMNYLPPEDLPELLHRLHLFIEPGGKFVFDFHSPEHLRALDGGTFVDESDDVFCLWRGEFDEEENALYYGMDIFRRDGKLWRREEEEHIEYAHSPEGLKALLKSSGFTDVRIITDGPLCESGRLFISATNLEH